MACILALSPSAMQAQYPRARRGEFEVPGLDFRRDGGWRKRVGEIRTERHRLLRSGNLSALNLAAPTAAAGTRVNGRVIIPVVPIAFRNAPPPFPSEAYDNVFFSSAPSDRPYSVKTFYEQLSNGNLTV
ncbi:MAG TPA: hypothetical protein VHK68_02255, partial [Gemmatimonadales bacterium]|nr:hypothetical protein [Gemmatimonadales bacterium]